MNFRTFLSPQKETHYVARIVVGMNGSEMTNTW